MYMIMFVSKDVSQAEKMMEVWLNVGVRGITILESAGMQQAAQRGLRDDIGIVFSLTKLMQSQEIHHRTLFSAVPDEATVNNVVKASTEFVGDWSQQDVGVLFVWPLSHAFGLDKQFNR
jgi:hypothetical protein